MEEAKLTTTNLIPPVSPGNKPRVLAFDFARGIAIFMMVLIHTAVFIGGYDLINTPTGYVVNSFVCILAAPVFMFVMGILFSLSSRTAFGVQLYRGLFVLLLGYGLNFLRGTLPVGAGMLFGLIEEDYPLHYMLEDDILQFAGIALIVMAVIKRAIPWSPGWFILGVAAAFVSPFVWNHGSDNVFVNYILSLFFGGEEYNYFPFFPWIAFPLIGMAYGDYFKRAKEHKRVFINGSYLGIILIIAGLLFELKFKTGIWTDWYLGKYRQGQIPIPVVMIFSGFQFLWIPLCHLITTKIPENRFFTLLFFWSKNVTSFYVIQWIIIGCVCIVLMDIEWPAVILLVIVITFFTDKFVRLYNNFKNKKTQVK
ncbi:MAG: DUF1624 domain-containing protein [Fibrobacter sp.]|nr:DUF1624 domain-containing protein [Fibrobacter sp.]